MYILSYLFIVNPIAGKRKDNTIIPIIKEVMDQYNCAYEIKITEKIGDAKLFAKEAKDKSFSTIVSVGGDGTLHEVVNGMAGGSQKLGIIPSGTGNDFARVLNIPFNLKEAVEILVRKKSASIDIGKLNDEYFINFCSVGLDALIGQEANKIKKYFSSTYAYIIGVIKCLIGFRSLKVDLTIDGKNYKEDIMLMAVCNGAYYGGGMKIAPLADFSDGEFDICIVSKMSKIKLLFLFPTIFKGKHLKYKEVKIYRGKEVQLFSTENINVNADGEIIKHRPIQFEIINKGIEVIIP